MADVCRRLASKLIPPSREAFCKELKELKTSLGNDARTRDRVDITLRSQFYVDDFLGSEDTSEAAVNVIRESIYRLIRYHVKLCKISSNHPSIRKEFQEATSLPSVVDFSADRIVMERAHSTDEDITNSLGLRWNTEDDTFQIMSKMEPRPYTMRGLLSYLMRPFDPLGFVLPALLSIDSCID